jgi:hypothetical protein
MKVIDVYAQYFAGECVYNEVERRGASVKLTSDSEGGQIRYTVSVNFFPFRDEEDYSISYDAYFEKEIYSAKGRRSKKREKELLELLPSVADELADEVQATILWDQPLIEARRG